MVAGYQQAREDLHLAARALLAFHGIEHPTREQQVGALLEAEFKIRLTRLARRFGG